MKSYSEKTMTPRMWVGLKELALGKTLDSRAYPQGHCVGRPTKQRLAKYGWATYVVPKDWDGPMLITERGKNLVAKIYLCSMYGKLSARSAEKG